MYKNKQEKTTASLPLNSDKVCIRKYFICKNVLFDGRKEGTEMEIGKEMKMEKQRERNQ